MDGRNPVSRFNYASALLARDRFREALEHLEVADESRPNDPETLDLMLVAAWALKDEDRVERYIERILEMDPENVEARLITSTRHLEAGRLDEAEALLLDVQVRSPSDPRTIYNIACLRARQLKPEEALAVLQQAINLDGAMAKAARSDPDFEILRSDPSVVAEFERITGPSEEAPDR
jgi:tetratricopeptide (TPR) repeat protein